MHHPATTRVCRELLHQDTRYCSTVTALRPGGSTVSTRQHWGSQAVNKILTQAEACLKQFIKQKIPPHLALIKPSLGEPGPHPRTIVPVHCYTAPLLTGRVSLRCPVTRQRWAEQEVKLLICSRLTAALQPCRFLISWDGEG